MARNRRNKRKINMITDTLDTKKFIIIISIFLAIILICAIYILIRNYNRNIQIAKQRQKLDEKIAAIFEDTSRTTSSEDNEQVNQNSITTNSELNDNNTAVENSEQPVYKQPDTTVNIAVVGDILCEKAMISDAKNNSSYSFEHMFQEILQIVNNCDISIGTLETNFTTNEYDDYPKCNSPKEFAQAVKNSGIDIVSLAHNHALDYGYNGLKQTYEYIKGLEYDTVGARTDLEQQRYIIKDVKGIRIAFLAYTYGVNGQSRLSKEELKYVNIYKEEEVKQDIESAKKEADYIIVMMHWGEVNSTNVTNGQQKIADFLVDNGVDAILGAHPAVVEPMEVIQNKNGKNVLIAYSVGNYISSLGYENSDLEMILNVQLRKDGQTGEVTLDKLTYTPIYMADYGTKANDRYKLIDMQETAKKYINGDTQIISQSIYNKLIKGLETLEKIIRSKN